MYFCKNIVANRRLLAKFGEEGSPMKRTNFSEQKHGAVIWITKKEAKRLEKRYNQ